MTKKPHDKKKKHSEADLEKIRKRAAEIWKRKCQTLTTALDDWLQAERELRKQLGIEHKSSADYTAEEFRKIKERAEAVRLIKVKSLRTAFDDWIEAEAEVKEELKGKINLHDLFDLWFSKASPAVTTMLTKDSVTTPAHIDAMLGEQYIDLMAECMT